MESTAPLPVTRIAGFVRSRGWLSQVIAGIVLLLVVAGVAANQYFSSRFGADGAALEYITELGAGDASTAFADVSVYDTVAAEPTTKFLTAAALKAQLALPENQMKVSAARVTSHQELGDQASVIVSYSDRGHQQSRTLTLVRDPGSRHFLIYPVWRVLIVSQILELAIPSAMGEVTIDGLKVPAAAKSLSVFPGVHEVATSANAVFAASILKVDAASSTYDAIKVAPTPKLAPGVEAQGKALIAGVFARCPQDTVLDGCVRTLYPTTDFKLIGDPTTDATFSVSASGEVQATGHYRMISSEPTSDPNRPVQDVIGGGFHAAFVAKPSGLISVSLSRADSTTPYVRPAEATDAAVRSAVGQAMRDCAQVARAYPVGCPQGFFSAVQLDSIQWSLVGDPTVGSSIDYSTVDGEFIVRGRYQMSFSYQQTDLGHIIKGNRSVAGDYIALVVWDGTAVRVVRIN